MAIDEAQRDALVRRRILGGVASNYIGKAITVGTWVVLTPFILGHLGPREYGIWTLIGSVVGYGALLDFGIGGAVIKYVAEYRAREADNEARALVATALRLYAVLGLLAVVLAVVLAPLFPALFRLSSEDGALASRIVVVMGITLGVSLPCSTASAVLRGLQRYDLVNLFAAIGALAGALGTVAVLQLGGGLLGMVAINLPLILLLQALQVRAIDRAAPELRFGWRGAERRLAWTVLSYSSSVFVIQAAGQLQSKTDEIVIGALLPVSAITPYALARKLAESAQLVTDQFLKVLLPLASELHAGDDHERLRALYIVSTRLTLGIVLPISCVLIFLAGPILTLWLGPAYASGAPLVIILTIASAIATSQWPAGNVLQGMARHRVLAAMALGNGLLNLALSLALAPRLGLLGVAIGTLVPNAIECLGLVLPYALRSVGVRPSEVWREIGLPALAPVFPTALVVWALGRLIVAPGLLPVGGVAGVGALVYAVGYFAFPTTALERRSGLVALRDAGRMIGRAIRRGRAIVSVRSGSD